MSVGFPCAGTNPAWLRIRVVNLSPTNLLLSVGLAVVCGCVAHVEQATPTRSEAHILRSSAAVEVLVGEEGHLRVIGSTQTSDNRGVPIPRARWWVQVFKPPSQELLRELRRVKATRLRFDIRGAPDGQRGLPASLLPKISQLRGLEAIQILGAAAVDSTHLAWLQQLPQLASLDLRGCSFTTRALASLAAFPALKNLTLSSACLASGDLAIVARIPRLQSLALPASRGMFGVVVSGIDDRELAFLAQARGLHTLDLSYCDKVTDRGLRHVAKLSGLKKLVMPGLRRVTSAGMKSLAELSQLEDLDLGGSDRNWTTVDDKCLEHLAKTPRLRKLKLGWNATSLSQAGWQTLGKISGLRTLDLGCLWINDEGLPQLARLKELRSVSRELWQSARWGELVGR